MRWVLACDHKRIGLLYVATGLFFTIVLGLSALLLMLDLDHAPGGLLDEFAHDQLATMEGTMALFCVGLPIALGLASHLVPLQIGAKGVVFPRLNASAFWLFLAGSLLLLVSFATGDSSADSPGAPLSPEGRQLWVLGLLFVSIAAAASSAALLGTIGSRRAPGVTPARAPIFVWASGLFALVAIFSSAVTTITCAIFLIDAGSADFFAFDVGSGGAAGFYENQIWFLGQPLTYALLLPALGAISELIPVFTRRPLRTRSLVLFGLFGVAALALVIALFHLIADAFSESFFRSIPLAGFIVLIPVALAVVSWLDALRDARPPVAAPLLFAAGAAQLLVLGAVLGLVFGFPGDYQGLTSYQLTAHFQGTLAGGILLALLGGLHYWFPKLTGRALDERMAKRQFGLVFLGANVLLVGQHVVGESGLGRAAASGEWTTGAKVGAGLSLAAFLLLFFGVAGFLAESVKSLRSGKRVGNDPWLADTLEWYTASPPPEHNFDGLPPIASARPLHDLRRRLGPGSRG